MMAPVPDDRRARGGFDGARPKPGKGKGQLLGINQRDDHEGRHRAGPRYLNAGR